MRQLCLLVAGLALALGCTRVDREAQPPPSYPAAPVLDPVTSPVNAPTAIISGTVPPGVQVTVTGGVTVVQGGADASGRFAFTTTLNTTAGQNTVNELVVVYLLGNSVSAPARARIVHDPVAPVPPEPEPGQSPTRDNPAAIAGLAEENSLVTVTGGLYQASAWADGTGNFSVSVTLFPNQTNLLYFTCTDAAGNTCLPRVLSLVHDDTPPAAAVAALLRAFHDGVKTVVEGNFGAVEADAQVLVTDTTTLLPPAVTTACGAGSFATAVAGGAPGNTIEIVLTDAAGNQSLPPHTTVITSIAWRDLNPGGTAPSARVWPAGVVDWAHNRLFVFGGLDITGAKDDGHFLSLLPGTEAWTPLSAAGGPAARLGHSADFDPVGSRIIVFGGTDPGIPAWFQDLFELDMTAVGSESWTALVGNTPPPARAHHAAAFDGASRTLYVYGGSDASGTLSDLWECQLGGPAPAWTALTPTGSAPPALSGACAAFDPRGLRFVLFGGRDGSGQLSNAVYVLDLSSTPAWSQPSATGTVPAAREGASAGLDTISGRLFVFGGRTASARTNDMHILDLATGVWSSPFSTGTPPALREGASMSFDPNRLRQVLFGGSSDASTGPLHQDAQALE